MAAGAKVDLAGADGETPLLAAASNGDDSMVQAAAGHGRSASTSPISTAKRPCGARLEQAPRRRRISLLAANANPNIADKDGLTPLMCAISYGHESLVATLLAAHARADASTGRGDTPLMLAAARGSDALVKSLLQHARAPSIGRTRTATRR